MNANPNTNELNQVFSPTNDRKYEEQLIEDSIPVSKDEPMTMQKLSEFPETFTDQQFEQNF